MNHDVRCFRMGFYVLGGFGFEIPLWLTALELYGCVEATSGHELGGKALPLVLYFTFSMS